MIKNFILSLLILFAATSVVYAANGDFNARKGNLTEVSAVRIGYGSGTVRIVIDTTAKIKFSESYAENPSRVIIDMHNTWLSPNVQREIELKSLAAKKVRIAQFNATTVRLVIESMADIKPFHLTGGPKGYRFVIDVGNVAFKENPELNKPDDDAQKKKQEQEKQEQIEREKQAQLERDRQAQLERDRQAQLERDKQAQIERDKQAQLERQERERLAKIENERQAQLEKERQERDRLEREHQERERQAQLEIERLERERQERERQDREREERARQERERLEQEAQTKEELELLKEQEKQERKLREKQEREMRELKEKQERELKKQQEKQERELRKQKEKEERDKKDRRDKDKNKDTEKNTDNDNDTYDNGTDVEKPFGDLNTELENLSALGGKRIVIDPGHGGNDAGAIGPTGIMEKNVTLKVSLELRKLLEAEGAEVIMTRDSDTTVSSKGASASDIEELGARCEVANRINADIFISIHADSFTRPEARGTTGYYYSRGAGSGQRLADCIRRNLIEQLGTPSRGTQPCNFYVVHHTDMPATLIELGFISNYEEEKLLNSAEGVRKAAQGILDGIEDYFG
ncbi:MAG: N-acetylmuramoyl-L-alanine amidase [Selenomonadaceae bacterium]|nr:N-acetylmuramoyl-L-alanine amidase [Selenomonadaceae bacterium]